LKNDFNLENIALKSGFSFYSTFFIVFKSEIGVMPSEYIKNVSGGVKKAELLFSFFNSFYSDL